jgi:hypothetical protein
MKAYCVFCCLVFFYPELKCQPQVNDITNWHPSSGNWSRLFVSSAAPFCTPSSFALFGDPAVRIEHDRPYFIEGLSDTKLYFILPVTAHAAAGLAVTRFGNDVFNELRVSAGYGRRLSDHWNIGILFSYEHTKIKGFTGSAGLYSAAGLQYFGKGFSAGLFAHTSFSDKQSQPKLFQQIGIGFAKEWSGQFYSDLQMFIQPGNKQTVNASLQYRIWEGWLIALRAETNPLRYGIETGMGWRKWHLLFSGNWHPALGWSPGIAISFPSGSQNVNDD